MEEFKLGSIVRKVLDETSETDVHKVSAEILNLIPEEHYREVILNLLPSYVRVAYGVQRNNTSAEWADDVVAPEPPRQREYAPKTYGSGSTSPERLRRRGSVSSGTVSMLLRAGTSSSRTATLTT